MNEWYDTGPIAFLITFTTYGTWLHGDVRGSVDRENRRYGAPRLAPDARRRRRAQERLKQSPVRLDAAARRAVRCAIDHTVQEREWALWALNVRTNHVHAVIAAARRPEVVVNAVKANATRMLRERGSWQGAGSPWSTGASTRYLWTEDSVKRAVRYVLHCQGPDLP